MPLDVGLKAGKSLERKRRLHPKGNGSVCHSTVDFEVNRPRPDHIDKKPRLPNKKRPRNKVVVRRQAILSRIANEQRSAATRVGKRYGDAVISGSARVIQGDIFNLCSAHYDASTVRKLFELHVKQLLPPLSPAGILEQSPSFRPFLYTAQTSGSMFYAYFARQSLVTETVKVSELSIRYISNVRHVDFHVNLIVTSESKSWSVWACSADNSYGPTLPKQLITRIQYQVGDITEVSPDRTYNILAGSQSSIEDVKMEGITIHPFNLRHRLMALTSSLLHLGCPWAYEKDCDQRNYWYNRQIWWFLACFNGRWLSATRFVADQRLFEVQKHKMEMLYRLRDSEPGLATFQGVLRDANGLVTCYLNALPQKGLLFRLMDEEHVSLIRRIRWCHQLIRTVARLHQKMYIIGCFGEEIDPGVGIDADDNAVISGAFVDTEVDKDECATPPECQNGPRIVTITYAMDLYQLGFMLWRIVGYKTSGLSEKFLAYKDHSLEQVNPDSKQSGDVDSRLFNGVECPSYLVEIIFSCHSRDPRDRLPARELLAKCPVDPPLPASILRSRSSAKDPSRPETYQKGYAASIYCDICGIYCSEHYYHCDICNDSNYDICVGCFASGLHCEDNRHYLSSYQWPQDSILYTNVKPSGNREVVTLNDVAFTTIDL